MPEVLEGSTADVYFPRARVVLDSMGLDPVVAMLTFPSRPGRFWGVQQVRQLLLESSFEGELWSLREGEHFVSGEPALLIRGRYSTFGIYETALLGILSSGCGWSTAAEECVEAASGVPVVSFGGRHVHPNVAAIMDTAAVAAGCAGCSTTLGAKLAGIEPSGTMPHALTLIVGDTVRTAEGFDAALPDDIPRIVLVDTFNDEAVEAVRVAQALLGRLRGVRLDTPHERGGVTAELVREVRARLDLAGFRDVEILVSGGMTPERMQALRTAGAPVDGFGVGSYIARASPIEFTGDIREIDGLPVAKRGRLPGVGDVSRLQRIPVGNTESY